MDFYSFKGDVYKRQVEGSENINVNSTVDPNTKAKTYKVALKDNVTLGSGNNAININGTTAVSYTHLDVYKRQYQLYVRNAG